jgi:predicted CXXCH cytochrome family protein
VIGLVLLGWGGWHFFHRPPSAPGFAASALTSESCRACHPAEYDTWRASHHGQAERPINLALDRTAFEPFHVFKAGSKTNQTRFSDGRLQILTMGSTTNIEPFSVQRVLGVEPLRQYLTDMGRGRWQVQEDSYDPRSNQWFDVFGNEDRQPGEWGQWTGRGMNWNSTCAECHNTRLQKNYDDATDSYHTTMDEMGVGCGACHAGMPQHAVWQKKHPGRKKDPTLAKPVAAQTLGVCGSCHSRREDLTGNFTPDKSFFNEYQLQILDETDTWFADGQVHGEDYEFEAFLGSKMSQRGIICIDCHNPHSAKTLLPGNNLCLRCHNGSFTNAPVIDPAAHSHHDPAGIGNQCIGCHMPVTVYMQRHERHDHGFTIPDPLLTREWAIPNACNRCHADKTADWSETYAKKWYGQKMERHTRERARWLASAQKGEDSAKPHLIEMLAPARESFYWRAAAAGLLWHWPQDAAVKTALLAALHDEHSLVRERAIGSIEPMIDAGDSDIAAAMQPLLKDPVRSVRVAAAWALRATVPIGIGAGLELQTMLDYNGDQPIGRYRKAMFALARHDPAESLSHLREAIAWDPYSPPFRYEIADVLAGLGQTNEAIHQLAELCRLLPESDEAQFKLGLALADAQQIEPAMAAFRQTVKLDPKNLLAWYNLGLTASAMGQVEESLAALDRAAALAPSDPQVPYEKARTLLRARRYPEARVAARQALKLQPGFKPAQDLLDTLSSD